MIAAQAVASAGGSQDLRIVPVVREVDMVHALTQMEADGLVRAQLVDGNWRWTLREGVE